jgi:Leucine-rich repeat (LRR) protein
MDREFLLILLPNINAIPPEIEKLSRLINLDLSNNQLTALPPEIGKLSELTDLYLNQNQLTALPPEIGMLRELTSLGLYSNQLTVLPPEIGKLNRLTNLDLGVNQFTKLPPEIEKLIGLKSLSLEGNQLNAFPYEILKISGLTNLDLSYNEITILLSEIGMLRELVILDLSGNPLKTIPSEFFSLPVCNTTFFISWLQDCSEKNNYELALSIRKGILNKNFENIYDFVHISLSLILCSDFEGAIWAGEQYKAKGGKSIDALSILAIGYLYNGNYEKALLLYKQYKNKKEGNKTGKEIFLHDLVRLQIIYQERYLRGREEAKNVYEEKYLRKREEVKNRGIVPKNQEDVDRIIRYLNEE